MNLDYNAEELAFRDEVRHFLAEHLPKDIRARQRDGSPHVGYPGKDDYVRWCRILNERGWAAPGWPEQYGGPGWNVVQRHIFDEECAMAGAPPPFPFGVGMVAPVLMEYGSEAQKERFLPRILNLDDVWCQGYSEPGSGSDLASLKMRAERDGDHYVVNGQKTWTTVAHWADWIFCLVRTETGRRKQDGISFLLIDMTTPGIEVRPIITIDGAHEINEVFFDNVRVPVENRVGEEGKGWSIAKFLLGHERTGNARIGYCKRQLDRLKQIAGSETAADDTSLADDPLFSARVAETEIEMMAMEITTLRDLSASRTGSASNVMPSIIKIRGTEIQQSLAQLMMEVAGPNAIRLEDETGLTHAEGPASRYLSLRATSIYGGSNEIQRNIVAKAVLGL